MRPTLARNYLHDWFGTGINVREGMQLGQTDIHTDIDMMGVAEYNLFDKVDIEQETISVKSSSNIVRFNTLIASRRITNRHGEDNLYLANWIEDSDGLNVHDQNNKVYGNRCVNCASNMGFMVMRGTTDPSSSVTSPAPWARNTELVGNIGRIRAAHSANPVLPENTRIAAGQDVVPGNGGTWTTFTYTGPALPATVKLTPADVGPQAGACQTIQHVEIDVQPLQLSLSSSSTINVIVRSRPGFDAVALNASLARLAIGGGPGVAPIMRGTTVNTSTGDFNGDGLVDRLISFRVSDLVAAGLTTTNRDFVLRTAAVPSAWVGRDLVLPMVVQ